MLLRDFKVELKQDKFYSCKNILIHEYLSHFNYRTDLEIVDVFNLDVIPAIRFEDNQFEMLHFSAECLGDNDYYNFYGINLFVKQHNDFDLGWSYIEDNLKNGKPIIVSGTQYYLKYAKTYLSNRYFADYGKGIYGICNHWIMVLGYKDNEVYIRDPSYQFVGYIPLEDFRKFWEGDSQFVDKIPLTDNLYQFGYIEVSVDEVKNNSVPQDIYYMSILRYLKVFLNREIVTDMRAFIGIDVYKKVIAIFGNGKIWNYNLLGVYNFFHLQKFNLKIVNNSLRIAFANNQEVLGVVDSLDSCVELMEEMCMKMYMCILRNEFSIASKRDIVVYLERILNILVESYELLLEKGDFDE